ncbi:hypothetical protein [Streptomyces drozdowiczii]
MFLLKCTGCNWGFLDPEEDDKGHTINVSFVRTRYLEVVNAARAHEVGTVLRYSHRGPSVVSGKDEETAA